MERNYMNSSQKKVKEEVIEIIDDPASAMQWSFTNQVSPHSQSPPVKAVQEDRPRKTGYDSLTSTGYMTISSTESLSSNQKSYSNMMQRNLSLEKNAGSQYPVANYPSQHFDAHAVQRPHEARSLSNANRINQLAPGSMSIPVQQPIITSSRPNMITSPVNLRLVEAVPTPVGPSSTSVVGNTDLRNNTKIPKAPAQLTIFYSGLVCVYDNVSPEKAQAIMLLAGNAPPLAPMSSMTPSSAVPTPSPVQAPIHRPSMASNAAVPSASQVHAPIVRPSTIPNAAAPAVSQAQAPIPRTSSIDSFLFNQSHSRGPGAGLLGHMSVTSNGTAQSAGLSSSAIDLASRRPTGISISHSTMQEAPRIINSLRHTPPGQPILNSSAVPQARKASLARFLEKRKERSTIAAPYETTQSPNYSALGEGSKSYNTSKSPDYSALGQGSKNFSMNSASSSSLPTIITLQ